MNSNAVPLRLARLEDAIGFAPEMIRFGSGDGSYIAIALTCRDWNGPARTGRRRRCERGHLGAQRRGAGEADRRADREQAVDQSRERPSVALLASRRRSDQEQSNKPIRIEAASCSSPPQQQEGEKRKMKATRGEDRQEPMSDLLRSRSRSVAKVCPPHAHAFPREAQTHLIGRGYDLFAADLRALVAQASSNRRDSTLSGLANHDVERAGATVAGMGAAHRRDPARGATRPAVAIAARSARAGTRPARGPCR